MGGTVRTFDPESAGDDHRADGGKWPPASPPRMGGSAELRYRRGYPVTINHAELNADYAAASGQAPWSARRPVVRDIDRR